MAEKEYIERERARHEFALYFQDSKKLVDECDSLICMLPTADVVEVRHGEWIDTVTGYSCSACHEQEPTKRFLYCPNCGAKMDGKGEGE